MKRVLITLAIVLAVVTGLIAAIEISRDNDNVAGDPPPAEDEVVPDAEDEVTLAAEGDDAGDTTGSADDGTDTGTAPHLGSGASGEVQGAQESAQVLAQTGRTTNLIAVAAAALVVAGVLARGGEMKLRRNHARRS